MLPLILTAAGAYGAVVLALFLGQSSLLYLPQVPTRTLVATPASIGLAFEDVWLDTADGERLHGWFIPAPQARGTLLFLHGNAGNISHRLDSLRIFHDLSLDVFMLDYRGYGQSSGRPSEAGLQRDAQAAWQHLAHTRGVEPQRIVLFGRSLGGSVAAELAAKLARDGAGHAAPSTPDSSVARPPRGTTNNADTPPAGPAPAALILESTFTSVPDLAAQLYPWLPARRLARLQHDALAALAHVRSPVLVVHSPRDEIIPYSHGQALYQAAPAARQFLELQGDHNNGFLQTGPRYRDGLAAFLDAYLPPP